MKTRTGFVSNSSSSSFIIGVGLATNKENIEKLKGYKNYDLEILPLSEVIAQEHNCRWGGDGYNADRDIFKVESFQYSEEVLKGIEETYLKYPSGVIVKLSTCEGDDCDFEVYDEDGDFCEYDYDIDFDFFSESTQQLVGKCEELSDKGTFSFHYGAGRNG